MVFPLFALLARFLSPRHHYKTFVPRKAHLSSKKLLEQCQKMEKLWGHVLTSTLPLHADNWYNKVTDLIEKQQTAPIWMSDSKVSAAQCSCIQFSIRDALNLGRGRMYYRLHEIVG